MRHEPNVCAGMAAGTIAGIVGTWAMSQFQAIWSKAAENFESPSAAGHHDARDWQERKEGANANEVAAQKIAAQFVDRPLTRDETAVGALLVHYAFGAAMGAMYGAMMARSSIASPATGAAFGTAVLIGGDKIMVPVLGLADRNADDSVEANAQAFFAHLVFGVTTELVRRALRR